MRSTPPHGVTRQPYPFFPVGPRPGPRRRSHRLALPALLCAMVLAACAGSTASPSTTATLPATSSTSPTTSPPQSAPVTTSAPPIALGAGAGGICPTATAVNAALSVSTSFADGGILGGNGATGYFLCNYKSYGPPGGPISIHFYKGMSATNVSQLMKGNPSATHTSVAGVGDQAITYSVSGIEVIIAAKGTTVIEIDIYGPVPFSLVESFTNRLF
jgi:hypothetical protein